MPKDHRLKTLPEHFDAVERGIKTAELRLDDRGYEVDDVLILERWSPEEGYHGRQLYRHISHILRGGPWLAEGYAMLSLRPLRQEAL